MATQHNVTLNNITSAVAGDYSNFSYSTKAGYIAYVFKYDFSATASIISINGVDIASITTVPFILSGSDRLVDWETCSNIVNTGGVWSIPVPSYLGKFTSSSVDYYVIFGKLSTTGTIDNTVGIGKAVNMILETTGPTLTSLSVDTSSLQGFPSTQPCSTVKEYYSPIALS